MNVKIGKECAFAKNAVVYSSKRRHGILFHLRIHGEHVKL
jgi:hypothetical protein